MIRCGSRDVPMDRIKASSARQRLAARGLPPLSSRQGLRRADRVQPRLWVSPKAAAPLCSAAAVQNLAENERFMGRVRVRGNGRPRFAAPRVCPLLSPSPRPSPSGRGRIEGPHRSVRGRPDVRPLTSLPSPETRENSAFCSRRLLFCPSLLFAPEEAAGMYLRVALCVAELDSAWRGGRPWRLARGGVCGFQIRDTAVQLCATPVCATSVLTSATSKRTRDGRIF